MYSVEAQSEEAEDLLYALFFGLLYPHEYTHYSKYFWMLELVENHKCKST